MKLLIRLGLILICLILVLGLTKNLIARFAVEKGVEFATGLPLKMDSLKISFLKTHIDIRELKIFNPKGFSDSIMVDMPVIFIDFNLPSLLRGNVHLEDVEIYLREFSVVRAADGRLNINSIKAVQTAEKKPAPPKKEVPAKKERPPEVNIERMGLRADRVTYQDFKGGKVSSREFKINLNEQYQNVTDLNQIIRIIVLKVMMNTPIAHLTGFDLGGLQSQVSGVLSSATKLAADAATLAQDTLKATTDQVTGVAGTGQDTLKGVTETTKGLLGGLKTEAGGIAGRLTSPFSRTEEE